MTPARKRELARADRVLQGVWRLRLPLPWPGVPHVNAWAIDAGEGIVLVDTGMHEPGSLERLEDALHRAGLRLADVRLLVCTHAHSDHYGLAGPIREAAGCELWMHPNHGHITRAAANPERLLERRLEVARQSGVPAEAIRRYQEARRSHGIGVAEIVLPDRDLLPGVEVETDLGAWQVHETPGHAPSHVCLHQPDRGLLISGDHLLGRVSLYYDFGYTPDPAGEFLESLDVVDVLGARLCLSGHGRPFRDVRAHVEANRVAVAERVERVRAAVGNGRPTPYEIVPKLLGMDEDRGPAKPARSLRPEAEAPDQNAGPDAPRSISPMLMNWGLSESLCYLRHLELQGVVEKVEGAEGEPERWALV